MLTALLPTRDRPVECARQLRFLRDNGFEHRIVVLDASEGAAALAVRAAALGIAEYRHFPRTERMADKLAAAVADVATPFVQLIPDDDLILPRAIAAALGFLAANPDYVCAHGYFIAFAAHRDDIEMHRVLGFTPSIADADPLRRHYELFRRYQSFYWGTFRTEVFRSAVTAACAMPVVLFRELTAMSVAILHGKVARLRRIQALRGAAVSHAAPHDSDPLLWLLRDAASFFAAYRQFRDHIAAFMRSRDIVPRDGVEPTQFLDLSYATFLSRQIDPGAINHAARLMLGDPLPAIEFASARGGWREPAADDLVHRAPSGTRRYIWRAELFNTEPRDEIDLRASDMEEVERQLDAFR